MTCHYRLPGARPPRSLPTATRFFRTAPWPERGIDRPGLYAITSQETPCFGCRLHFKTLLLPVIDDLALLLRLAWATCKARHRSLEIVKIYQDSIGDAAPILRIYPRHCAGLFQGFASRGWTRSPLICECKAHPVDGAELNGGDVFMGVE